jgi:hypothetical protein
MGFLVENVTVRRGFLPKLCSPYQLFLPILHILSINPLNAELNPIFHLLVLLGDLTFMGTCIVSIFQYIYPTRYSVTQFIYIWKLLYMFRVWQIPDAVDTVVCAPDDEWKYQPKHVEQFPDINKLCNVVSCWIYEYIEILLGAHPILHISSIRVKGWSSNTISGHGTTGFRSRPKPNSTNIILRKDRDVIRSFIFCYRNSKLALCFGCIKWPSLGRTYQKM